MPTTRIIVEASIQSPTGLPKDVFINVWHFLDVLGASPASVALTAFGKINDFYTKEGATAQVKVGDFLERSEDDIMTLTAYDFAAAKPRPVIGQATFVKGAAGSIGMPEQIALCLSYYTDRNIPTKRGRLYLGPLNIGALNGAMSSPVRPKDVLLTAIGEAAIRMRIVGNVDPFPAMVTNSLANQPLSGGTAWALYSPKLGTFAAIEHGWIDDEWDGQRRRRVEASLRQPF